MKSNLEINPSANGWIEKFFLLHQLNIEKYTNEADFYLKVQQSGLICGLVLQYHLKTPINDEVWQTEEKTKVVFLTSLYSIYQLNKTDDDFVETAVKFYENISKSKFSFLEKFLPESSNFSKLEDIIEGRIKNNTNVFTKNFNHLLTNAFLFIDVLAFDFYLKNNQINLKYFSQFEQQAMGLITLSLRLKNNLSETDDLLIKLFENSLKYSKKTDANKNFELTDLKIENLTNLEKIYLLDLVYLSMWSDGDKEEFEQTFINNLISYLGLNNLALNSGCQIDKFIIENKNNIPFFNLKHPVQHFYNNMQEQITALIERNKNRFTKELSESKELMILLKKAAQQDLDYNEKRQVKKQLLDICKTVPSLTIFLLPGGAFLLPILIKFIPKLLPSSFNENLD